MRQLTVASVFLLLGLFLAADLNAQTRRAIQNREHPTARGQNLKYFSVGGFLAGMTYFGDLAPTSDIGSTSIPLTRAGFGITGSYRFKRFLSWRTSLMWGRLKGDDIVADMYDVDDKFRYTRNLHFRNDIKELSFDIVIDFFNHHRTFATRRKVSPYMFIGVAVFHHIQANIVLLYLKVLKQSSHPGKLLHSADHSVGSAEDQTYRNVRHPFQGLLPLDYDGTPQHL